MHFAVDWYEQQRIRKLNDDAFSSDSYQKHSMEKFFPLGFFGWNIVTWKSKIQILQLQPKHIDNICGKIWNITNEANRCTEQNHQQIEELWALVLRSLQYFTSELALPLDVLGFGGFDVRDGFDKVTWNTPKETKYPLNDSFEHFFKKRQLAKQKIHQPPTLTQQQE